MLKQLCITNIILVEKADIKFNRGLNTLTGETGSGKSAILHGLNLAIGERADSGIIRKGCDKGYVEAVFDCSLPAVLSLLDEGGIEHENDQDLIIRREITSTGKGRVFINNQLAQLSFLKKLGVALIQVVGQHANQRLLSIDYHRSILDLFGNLSQHIIEFRQSFEHENALQKKLTALTQEEAHRLREIAVCQREIEELEEAQLKEGEDEDLFVEYTLLVNAEEVSGKVTEITSALTGDRNSVLISLNRQKINIETLTSYDPHLLDTCNAFQNALLELQEIAYTFRHYQNKLQSNPERLRLVNDRLALINRLKRKYGSTAAEILVYLGQTKEKLFQLENADVEVEQLQAELLEAQSQTHALAKRLTEARENAAEQLQKALTLELGYLNMPKAVFHVQVKNQRRAKEGDDQVEFFLSPNVGEHQIPLKESASGGEISRVLLALQTLLAGKEQISTLVFDEVDGNIGGETATIVGDKLRRIAVQHQVICITHFPQVANQADHHLQISKEEIEGRTLTLVKELDKTSRKKELLRMAGIKKE